MKKFMYIYGIKDKPETYHSKVFTLNDIERGSQMDYICDSSSFKKHIVIKRIQYVNSKDSRSVELFEGDILNVTVKDENSFKHVVGGHYLEHTLGVYDTKTIPWYRKDAIIIKIGNKHLNPELWDDKQQDLF